jgi:hypothetical protein
MLVVFRYREELARNSDPHEALLTTWPPPARDDLLGIHGRGRPGAARVPAGAVHFARWGSASPVARRRPRACSYSSGGEAFGFPRSPGRPARSERPDRADPRRRIQRLGRAAVLIWFAEALAPDRGLDPDLSVCGAVRPVDGLRGIPAVADARGVGQHPRQRARRRLRLEHTGRIITAGWLPGPREAQRLGTDAARRPGRMRRDEPGFTVKPNSSRWLTFAPPPKTRRGPASRVPASDSLSAPTAGLGTTSGKSVADAQTPRAAKSCEKRP